MQERRDVALFVTCLVDLFRPSVGFAAVKLLEDAGCTVHVPRAQTCCGQPAYNTGDRESARRIAENVIAAFEGFGTIVAPSGSCAGMLRCHYPKLFENDAVWEPRARAVAERTWELVSFLTDVLAVDRVSAAFDGRVTYHDGCSGLRELGIAAQPRRLLQTVVGLSLEEMSTPDVCCGFGGTFCIKHPVISDAMVADKAADIAKSGAGTVLAGDLGCLMNIAGKLSRTGSPVAARHVAEVLAGDFSTPPIGRAKH